MEIAFAIKLRGWLISSHAIHCHPPLAPTGDHSAGTGGLADRNLSAHGDTYAVNSVAA